MTEKRVISEPFTWSKESELESRIKELEIELDHERSLFSGMSDKLVEISNKYGDVYTRLKEAEDKLQRGILLLKDQIESYDKHAPFCHYGRLNSPKEKCMCGALDFIERRDEFIENNYK